jgi:hypothetical protein
MAAITDDGNEKLHPAPAPRVDQGSSVQLAIERQIQRNALARSEHSKPHERFGGCTGEICMPGCAHGASLSA